MHLYGYLLISKENDLFFWIQINRNVFTKNLQRTRRISKNRGSCMNANVPESRKISPFLVFFLITSMQFGVGILGFQRFIAKSAGYDAWMSIILAGLMIHIILWMMLKMLKIANG